jgi:3-hydroxyacyl-CoA dehydrogenase/enoyl-CoA hydratase/3-hydroxybutyryl-CoA epimerase
MRLFLPMVNEAAYILADKICDKAATIDVGMIYGTGFPPFKGGLLRWADQEGLEQIVVRLNNFAKEVWEHLSNIWIFSGRFAFLIV